MCSVYRRILLTAMSAGVWAVAAVGSGAAVAAATDSSPTGRPGRVASLTRAAEHLAATYPGKYDVDKKIRTALADIKARLGRDIDAKALAEIDAKLARLSRRALLATNPLMQFGRLLFVRRQSLGWGGGHYAYNETLSWFREGPVRRVFRPGAALCTLDPTRPGGKVAVLAASPTGIIRDPDVHYDGKRVLFADKRSLNEDDYHLYEYDLASGKVTPLTKEAGFADYEGCYLPDGNIIFNSTRCVQTVDCYPTPVSNLYLMDSRGRHIRRLTVNHVHDNFPTVLNDGRVVFTRWEYNDRWVIHVQGLAVINPDGTGQAEFYGNNSYWPISMLHARAIPGTGKIVATLSGHHNVDQCGEIGIFDPRRGRDEAAGCVRLWPERQIRPIKNEYYWHKLSALYQYPWPLSENFFLVSCKPRGTKHFGIYLIDTFGNRELIHAEAGISCASPMPLAPRRPAPVVPSKVRYGQPDATVALMDVYDGPGLKGVKRGEVKALRVIEMINRPMGNRQWAGMDGTPPMGLNSTWDAKRVVGIVPVDAGGSAVFKVPALTAIYFQPLDAGGKAIQWERSWVTLQPGERRACTGCHEAGNTAPATRRAAQVLSRKPVMPDRRWCAADRPLTFHQDVQPVLDSACIRCHNQDHKRGLDFRGDKTDGFSLGYENLRPFVKVSGTRSQPPAIPAKSVGAIASPVIAMLERGHNKVVLTPEQKSRLITWIDVGAPYYGSYALTRYDAPFGRCIVRDSRPLWRALGSECNRCHKPSRVPGVPEGGLWRPRKGRGFLWRSGQNYDSSNAVMLNLTHADQSRLLRGPLGRSSGGLGLCKGFAFSGKDDPRYRAALGVISGWARELADKPREDMPGATPCKEYTLWMTKRRQSDAIDGKSRRALAEAQGKSPEP